MLKTKSTEHSRNKHHKINLHIDYDAHKLQSWTSSQGRIQNRKLFNYIENDKGKSICDAQKNVLPHSLQHTRQTLSISHPFERSIFSLYSFKSSGASSL
ncbi:LOW QUALITY PROTEIN: hypothetical protein PanWU01x14_007620 [Parasponia andersonii]|uniref:Uncharacterized protein n=1 Tax=Parasponia andersonii TaxID=3476 RepID=A0A2P5E452_PARAD|nr:LOW QUALITY PROTEIN: hypothetical protein PanWU01x14_007620 [Parasponia andersonii]